ncbi:MAG: decaprenyl-phosphate phosphoribosyltransferase [Chloroflexi bacterium]|nr:decaprenyl-phosphate phosphoribosyltransferase [Chloroflexota bacterium]MCL5109680.1 decaprenyl-phosphate phosphoribosyltransferase [Chloroflexota bacterium]
MATTDEASPGVTVLTRRGGIALALLVSARPKQWTKNVLLFVGLVFALKLTHLELVSLAAAAFVVFCALASGVYLINDLADVAKDRTHPQKRYRPIASGALPRPVAVAAASVLLVGGLVGAFLINLPFGLLAVGYIGLTTAYTLAFKHIVILDVFSLAAGYVLRAVAGAVAVSVPISSWLYVCTMLGALFLGITKRRHELVLLEGEASNHRPILQEYTPELLEQMTAVVTSALVMAYSLYTFSAPNLPQNQSMMLTIPFVLYGVFRYLYLVHMKEAGGSPEEVLLQDKPLLADGILWMVSCAVVLYFFR